MTWTIIQIVTLCAAASILLGIAAEAASITRFTRVLLSVLGLICACAALLLLGPVLSVAKLHGAFAYILAGIIILIVVLYGSDWMRMLLRRLDYVHDH